MPELTREEKLKLVEKLPQRLQDFLYSEDTGAVLLYFGKKYNLGDEKTRMLSKLVGDIILGITPITSLAQEINSKITPDMQASMHMAQELYAELLSPAMAEAKPVAQTAPTAPTPQPPVLTPVPKPIAPVTPPIATPTPLAVPAPTVIQPPKPPVDQYREPITTGPEIIDLRKTPPAPIQMPVAAAPIPPLPKPISPLTFTKPIEPPAAMPPPLIEAEPHKKEKEERMPEPPRPPVMQPIEPVKQTEKPQFIIRPPGLAPTDAPRNILDLRKDKGEF